MRTVNEWTVDVVSALLLTLSLMILLSLLTYRVNAKTFVPVQEHAVVLRPGALADGSIRGSPSARHTLHELNRSIDGGRLADCYI